MDIGPGGARSVRRLVACDGRGAADAAATAAGIRGSCKTEEPPAHGPIADPASSCLAKLIAGGASAEAATAPPVSAEGCGIDAPIRLSSIMADGGAVSLPDRPLVACEFAAVLADYVRLIVAPLGQAMLSAKVAAIETGPGYDCRTQDRIAGAKISAHGHGLAVDFAAITLSDKRRILVERQTSPEETSYFRAVRTAACGWFTTVLGRARTPSTPTTCTSTSSCTAQPPVIASANNVSVLAKDRMLSAPPRPEGFPRRVSTDMIRRGGQAIIRDLGRGSCAPAHESWGTAGASRIEEKTAFESGGWKKKMGVEASRAGLPAGSQKRGKSYLDRPLTY